MSHTQGPWVATKTNGEWNISAPTDRCLFGNPNYYPYCSSNDDDWPLVAAAPELLRLLKEGEFLYRNYGLVAGQVGEPGKWINEVRDAIAKATGAK